MPPLGCGHVDKKYYSLDEHLQKEERGHNHSQLFSNAVWSVAVQGVYKPIHNH